MADIEFSMGEKAFAKTKLGQAVDNISQDLFIDYKVRDADTVNCFLDKSTNTLYFFDLYATMSSL